MSQPLRMSFIKWAIKYRAGDDAGFLSVVYRYCSDAQNDLDGLLFFDTRAKARDWIKEHKSKQGKYCDNLTVVKTHIQVWEMK